MESGLYYLQTRYYDPTIGQLISPDSYEYLDPKKLTGLNLYAYCCNNPVMRESDYNLPARPIGFSKIISDKRNPIGGASSPNSVIMTNYSKSVVDNALLGMMMGNISFTTTTQHNEAGILYKFVNIGNSTSSGGIGLNIKNWFGMSVYVSSNLGIGLSAQLSPYFTYGAEISVLDGISFSLGKISGNVTKEINVNIGWGSLALAYAIGAGVSAIPVPGARVVGAVTALLILFIGIFK